jgi:hypothetical protein
MADETTNIRVIPFNGGSQKSNYRPRRIKTLAIGNKYGWMEALESDFSHLGVTGTALMDEIKEEKKKNGNKAVTYLVPSCMDTKAITNTVTNAKCIINGYAMWESLKWKYEADGDNGLVGLIGEFATSRLELGKEDPEEWISRLEIMSQGMLALDEKYEKSEQEIIAHTFAHLPRG